MKTIKEQTLRERCPECKNPFNLPEDYEDFSNKNLIRCPQCNELTTTIIEVEQ